MNEFPDCAVSEGAVWDLRYPCATQFPPAVRRAFRAKKPGNFFLTILGRPAMRLFKAEL